ncbi:hypothetical protein [Dactylosporangium sp. NPDC051541]|uniref:hypothetical protein n=1 Tax=Dactylosporangium sp. NPDC051541 TaxID=3363977 RepID=UPI003790D135
MQVDEFQELSDRSVVLALQELAAELPMGPVRSEDDARAVVGELLRIADVAAPDPDTLLQAEPEANAAARRALALAVRDPDLGPAAAALVADPPADEQLAVDLLIAGGAVLAVLLGWLQTKMDLRISRKDGRTEFSFRLGKAAASPELLQSVAGTIAAVIGARPAAPVVGARPAGAATAAPMDGAAEAGPAADAGG